MSNNKENHQFKRFGRYLILDHLVDGGMAKIFRARFLGEKADKIVAIKMVQPQYSSDKNFQEMFDVELKLAFALHHPIICQTYDYGQHKGVWYTAMEYVDGKNLKQILDRLKKRNESFPTHLVAFVISQVCQGLYYAHTFTDKFSGEHYKIIHRDISPHNIMVTYDGAVKVIDFGIAKTEVQEKDATQAGTIKGKLSYLAPEYIEGQELDQRYDMFAVGITMWEMLCGRKLFVGANDISIINEIRTCKIAAPSTINPTVPKELDVIVLKALNKDRDLRYKDMNAFCKALLKFLYGQFPDFNPLDLADFTRDIFSDEIKKDREKLRDFGRMNINPFIQEMLAETTNRDPAASQKAAKPVVDPATVEKLIQENRRLEMEMPSIDGKTNLTLEGDLPPQIQGAQNRSVIRGSPGVARGATRNNQHTGITPRSGSTGQRNKTVGHTMDHVRGNYQSSHGNSKASNGGSFFKTALMVCFIAGMVMYGLIQSGVDVASYFPAKVRHFFPATRDISGSKDLPEANKKSVTKSTSGVLYFENFQPGMTLTLNGKLVEYSPLGIKVPLNQELHIIVASGAAGSVENKVILTAEKDSLKIKIPTFERKNEGYLTISKQYKTGSKLVYFFDGKKIEEPLPVSNYRIPAGEHRAVIVGPNNTTLERMKLKIEENKNHILED